MLVQPPLRGIAADRKHDATCRTDRSRIACRIYALL